MGVRIAAPAGGSPEVRPVSCSGRLSWGMSLVLALLIVVVVVLFGQLQELRRRVKALEERQAVAWPRPETGADVGTEQNPEAVPLRPAQPSARQPSSGQLSPVPQNAAWVVPVVSRDQVGPAQSAGTPAPEGPPAPASAPINVQLWLTRAGVAATLLGLAYVLAVLESRGLIPAWWRVLAGALLGAWLSWRALREAPGRRWAAEVLGSLGVSVTLLTLTFAARSGSGGVPWVWALLLTLMSLASLMLSRRWGGVGTPVTALSALSVALLLARSVPGGNLWGLDPAALVCMAWALSVLAMLPLLLRERGWKVALPGGAALLLLAVYTSLVELGALREGGPGQQAGMVLLVSLTALLGVLLRSDQGQPELGRSELTLRSLVGTLALGTAVGALCRVTGVPLHWAVPLAVLAMTVPLLLSRCRKMFPFAPEPQVLRRVAFSAALSAALTATGYGLALHTGDAGGSDWGPALAAFASALLGAWLLRGWTRLRVRAEVFLAALSLCAPLGLLFGPAGAALPLVVWLARRGETLPRRPTWNTLRDWSPGPLALWALLALPLLAWDGVYGGVLNTGLLDGGLARTGEQALLLFGSAALTVYALDRLRRPSSGRSSWVLAALLAWSGAWLLAWVLSTGQGIQSGDFMLTTPWLALLGGWLLSRAQPARPGAVPWKTALWGSGAALLVLALFRVLLSDLSDSDALVRAAGLLGAGLVTVLAAVRFPPPKREGEPGTVE